MESSITLDKRSGHHRWSSKLINRKAHRVRDINCRNCEVSVFPGIRQDDRYRLSACPPRFRCASTLSKLSNRFHACGERCWSRSDRNTGRSPLFQPGLLLSRRTLTNKQWLMTLSLGDLPRLVEMTRTEIERERGTFESKWRRKREK